MRAMSHRINISHKQETIRTDCQILVYIPEVYRSSLHRSLIKQVFVYLPKRHTVRQAACINMSQTDKDGIIGIKNTVHVIQFSSKHDYKFKF